ncbi:MAG: DUF2911 domain-containing protein [Bacteroidota bacterium]
MKKSILSFCLVFMGILLMCHGQSISTTLPRGSQKAIVGQTIGLTEVMLTYHRPAVNERKVWGKLVPYDVVWRAGANENTIISFSKDVRIEGKPLAAGTYGLHMIPSESDWQIIFSNNSTSWGSFSYNPAEDALRVSVKAQNTPGHIEQLSYTFGDIKADRANCQMMWGKKMVDFSIETDVHAQVLANIRNEMRNKAGWTWRGWHEAANYCLQNEVNLQEAMAWATRSVFMSPTPQNLITKARLSAKNQGQEGDQAMASMIASLDNDLTSFSVSWREYFGCATYLNRQQSHPEKALAWMEKSVEMSPNMTNMMAQAQMLASNGEEKAAGKIKKAAIARGTNNELNTYGYTLLNTGRTQEAIDIFVANTEKHPKDPNVWDSLGDGYSRIGEKDKAVAALKKSLSMNPPANVKANSLRLLRQLGVDTSQNQ